MDFDHRGASRGARSRGKLAGGLILIAGLSLMPATLHGQADSFGAPPAPADDILEPADPGWDSVNNLATGSDGQVLELPQAVTDDDSASMSSADPSDDPDATLAPDATVADDPSDNLDGFENRQVSGSDSGEAAMPRPLMVYPPLGSALGPGWRFVTVGPPTVIVIRPSGLSPLPATSPMLTTPRGSGPVWGGWWHRIR